MRTFGNSTSDTTAQGQPNSPFNFIQVIIGALGTTYLNVIIFFLAGAAGASRRIGPNPTDIVAFDRVLQFTLIPILFFGLAVFLIGRANKAYARSRSGLASPSLSCRSPSRS